MSESRKFQAYFAEQAQAVVVNMTTRDRDIVREAQRWTASFRGAVVEDSTELARADLTAFATEALHIGAHALSVTGQAQESRALERMVKEVGDKTADSATQAAQLTKRTVTDAAEAVTKATESARKAITDVEAETRKELTAAVGSWRSEINSELLRIFAGENPELVARLQPVLDRFGRDLDAKVSTSTGELLARAARQFDPSDPTSPMAKHAAELIARQDRLTQQLDKNHLELAEKVTELTAAFRVQQARTTLAKVTPIKGDTYERQIHALMDSIAAGLGTSTRTRVAWSVSCLGARRATAC